MRVTHSTTQARASPIIMLYLCQWQACWNRYSIDFDDSVSFFFFLLWFLKVQMDTVKVEKEEESVCPSIFLIFLQPWMVRSPEQDTERQEEGPPSREGPNHRCRGCGKEEGGRVGQWGEGRKAPGSARRRRRGVLLPLQALWPWVQVRGHDKL